VDEIFEHQTNVDGVVGQVRLHRLMILKPLYSFTGLDPNLSLLRAKDRFIWVKANSVCSPMPVVRRVNIHKLHAMWDYEGKLECKHWLSDQNFKTLTYRLISPPAKIV